MRQILLVFTALVTLAASMTSVAMTATPAEAQQQCDHIVMLGARGSGTPPGLGPRLERLDAELQRRMLQLSDNYRIEAADRVIERPVRYSSAAIDYPAPGAFDLNVPANYLTGFFFDSVRLGASEMFSEVLTRNFQCPDQLFILAGFSQGAAAAHTAVVRLSEERPDLANQVVAVVLLSDPLRDPWVVRSQSGNGDADGLARAAELLLPGADLLRDVGTIPYPVALRTLDYCKGRDPVCDSEPAPNPFHHTGSAFYIDRYPAHAANQIMRMLWEYPGSAYHQPGASQLEVSYLYLREDVPSLGSNRFVIGKTIRRRPRFQVTGSSLPPRVRLTRRGVLSGYLRLDFDYQATYFVNYTQINRYGLTVADTLAIYPFVR